MPQRFGKISFVWGHLNMLCTKFGEDRMEYVPTEAKIVFTKKSQMAEMILGANECGLYRPIWDHPRNILQILFGLASLFMSY